MSLAHGNLAVTLSELGRHAEAEVQLRTALEIAQETLVPEHPRIAGIKVNLAHALIERGRCQEMERDLRAIVTTPPPARLERERRVAAAHVVLGRCLVLRRQFAEAEHLLIAGYEMAVGPPRRERDLRRAAVALVSLYEATGRREMAAPYRAVIQ
jgi:Flp pilus assembly protein TadD